MAKNFVKSAKRTDWYPQIRARLANKSVWASKPTLPDLQSRHDEAETQKPEADQTGAGSQKQPARAVEQKEAQRPPAVPERPEMGSVRLAAVRMQGDRHFGDAGSREARLDHHFRGEFHSRAALVQPGGKLLREPTHPAVDVVDGSAKPLAREPGKHRVSQPPMEHRHGSRKDRSASGRQPTTLHQARNPAAVSRRTGESL